MRRLVLYTLLSVDGVAEDPDRYVFAFDEAMHANLCRVIDTQDAVLLGRRTYDEWAAYWPAVEDHPFADFINGVRKYVVTSTPPAAPWANTTVVSGPIPQYVRDLKEQPGGDIGIHGSIRLARLLIASDLVDELRLVISPTLSGSGRKLFEDDDKLRSLTLLRVEGTASGALLVDYGLQTKQ